MVDDAREACVGHEPRPARLGHPQPVLALVREAPGALVQAPQAAGVRGGRLVDEQEAAGGQRPADVGQRLCCSSGGVMRSEGGSAPWHCLTLMLWGLTLMQGFK